MRGNSRLSVSIVVPPIPADDLYRMNRRRSLLARFYNVLGAFPLTAWIFRAVGSAFRVSGRKREDAPARP